MKSLLDALQEGRLVELPVNDKDKALEYLALLIEAIPDIGGNQDLVADVKKREGVANTALGMGVACPHVRTKQEGGLLCAVGWSPEGIDYGASDRKTVHLLIMYYIPDSQRNSYLKEVSGLAKAVRETEGIESFKDVRDIQSVRSKLLDWVEIAINKATPDSKARMIKLEEKQAIAASALVQQGLLKSKLSIIPFSILILDSQKSIVLANTPEMIDTFETSSEIAKHLETNAPFELAGYQITAISSTNYSKNRTMYNCVAVKFKNPA